MLDAWFLKEKWDKCSHILIINDSYLISYTKPLIQCLAFKRHSVQGWLLLSALLLNEEFIIAAPQAQNLQEIRLELEDLGCEHIDLIKQKTLS